MARETPPADALDSLARGVVRAVARRFEVDLRALAGFRIAVGTLLLADLALRSRDLVAFYTDDGVLPREALVSTHGSAYSLHAVSGEAWVQVVLFLLAGGFALATTVGYRTRSATAASFLLLTSLHLRNPLVLNGGDTLLRMLLFWGIFLPLGERWALGAGSTGRDRADSGRDDPDRADRERTDRGRSARGLPTAVSIGTVALLSQVVLMYATNAVHKTRSDAWMNGEALVYIFSADHLTVLLGNVLAEYHALLELFTPVWVALLLTAPLLLLLTGVARAALASVFVGAHIGMALTLDIGLFPLVAVAGLLPFYPPVVWDAVESLASRTGVADALRSTLSILSPFSTFSILSTLPGLPTVPAPSLPAVPVRSEWRDRIRAVCLRVLPCVAFALVLAANAAAVDYAEAPDPADRALDALDQDWRMFAPNPPRTTRWFAAPGALENGTEVDVFRGARASPDRPPSAEDAYPNARWRKYLSNVRWRGSAEHRAALGGYLCDRWNATRETGVESVTIYAVHERTDPYSGTTSTGEVELGEYECAGGLVQNGG